MRYQIQKYALEDYSRREVVAESDLDTLEDANKWMTSLSSGFAQETGIGFTLVPVDHNWFISQSVAEVPRNAPTVFEAEPCNFEEVVKVEQALSHRRRLEQYEYELAKAEALEKLMRK